ncbi:MAG: LysE family translocator [Gaiella sp.]
MIVEPATLWVFALAALALAVVPGPAVLYIVAQSVPGGRAVGAVSALGVASGGFVHLLAAVIGLSAVLAASAAAFTAVKLLGAAYLLWLGVRTLLTRGDERIGGRLPEPTLRRVYTQGVVVNILNPKTALFFLAFLPQFVDPDEPARPQLALLGAVFVVIALTSDLVWAVVAGTAGDVLRRSPRVLALQRWVSGLVLIALGIAAALTGHRPSRA